RFQRGDPAVANPQLRSEPRRAARQSGREHSLSAGAAELCGDRVVSPQAAGQSARSQALVSDVEHFAMDDYAHALGEGAALSDAERDAVAEKLHQYTGLSVAYIKKANLRIDGGMFEQNLQGDTDTATGRLDSRFSGPTMDPLSKETDYDPQGAAISSAYVSAFNDYVRRDLHFGRDKQFKPE